jgi:hypothetical protein
VADKIGACRLDGVGAGRSGYWADRLWQLDEAIAEKLR